MGNFGIISQNSRTSMSMSYRNATIENGFTTNLHDYYTKNEPKTLQEALYQYRKINRLSRRAAANLLGVKEDTYKKWETKNHVPKEMFIKMKEMFNLNGNLEVSFTTRRFYRKKNKPSIVKGTTDF